MRIMGIDYGDSRVGIAVSDPLMFMAQGLKTIPNKVYSKMLASVVDIANEYEISTIVIGLPKNMDGTLGFRADITKDFAKDLEKEISEKLSLVPCVTKVDNLIIATVSNWGAFGMMAYLDLLAGTKYFPPYEVFKRYLDQTVELGSVDGLSKENVGTVDGFSQDIEKEIVDGLYAVVHCA